MSHPRSGCSFLRFVSSEWPTLCQALGRRLNTPPTTHMNTCPPPTPTCTCLWAEACHVGTDSVTFPQLSCKLRHPPVSWVSRRPPCSGAPLLRRCCFRPRVYLSGGLVTSLWAHGYLLYSLGSDPILSQPFCPRWPSLALGGLSSSPGLLGAVSCFLCLQGVLTPVLRQWPGVATFSGKPVPRVGGWREMPGPGPWLSCPCGLSALTASEHAGLGVGHTHQVAPAHAAPLLCVTVWPG